MLLKFQLNLIQKEDNAHFGQTTWKYIIIIYALGSANEKFRVWIKAIPESFQSQNSWLD